MKFDCMFWYQCGLVLDVTNIRFDLGKPKVAPCSTFSCTDSIAACRWYKIRQDVFPGLICLPLILTSAGAGSEPKASQTQTSLLLRFRSLQLHQLKKTSDSGVNVGLLPCFILKCLSVIWVSMVSFPVYCQVSWFPLRGLVLLWAPLKICSNKHQRKQQKPILTVKDVLKLPNQSMCLHFEYQRNPSNITHWPKTCAAKPGSKVTGSHGPIIILS